MKPWSCLLVAAVVSTSLPAASQTLQDTLVKAYNSNPTLRAARAALRSTDEGVPQALSNWRPTVKLSSYGEWNVSDSTTTGAARVGDVTYPRAGSVAVSENVYRGGRTSAAVAGAESDVKAGRASLAATEQTVLVNAATAYADVVRDQAVLDLNINNERVLQRQLEATQDRFRVGEVTRTDVSQAESRLALARAERTSAEGSLADSRATYKNVVGEDPPVLKPAEPLGDLPANLGDTVTQAEEKNYTVQRAHYVEESARHNVDEITGELGPTVNLSGSVLTNAEVSTQYSKNTEAAVTLTVSLPLYSSGSVSSRVRAAKQVVGQRRDEYNQAVRNAIQSATSAWQLLETARAQVTAFTAGVNAAQIALEGVREEANVGSRTVLDVLNAEQELLTQRVGLVRAQHDVLVGTFQVRQAVGNLTAMSLKLPVDQYDPTKHYKEVRDKWWGLEASDGR